MNRRHFIKLGTIGTLAAANCALGAGKSLATPGEIEGPFYPRLIQQEQDADLTKMAGHKDRALGKHITIMGNVFDTEGKPVEGATVDLWQANAAGKYHHPYDSNPAPVDHHFQGWAIMLTNSQGEFQCKTVLPGAYPVDSHWVRPPHIHFKVSKKGFVELTTQMYFPDHALNQADKLLQRKNQDQQQRMIAEKIPQKPDAFLYNIVIERA